MKRTPTQLDADIAEALASPPKRPPPDLKRRMYDVNPASPDVIQAFLTSGYAADETGIQEFIAKRYAGWMSKYRQRYAARHKPRSTGVTTDPADVWATLIAEFTAALRTHGIHVKD